MTRLLTVCLVLVVITGCQTPHSDRIPATAVDNPDPIFGGTSKPGQVSPPPVVAGNQTQPVVSSPPTSNNGLPATPTGQKQPASTERIGPLNFQQKPVSPPPAEPIAGLSPGTANLTSQVKDVKPPPVQDSQVQPVQGYLPASNPQIVQEYKQRMIQHGVVGLRTKPIGNGSWEAVGHFPTPDQPNQLRRIEAQGVTEADALLAIVEQLDKPR